MKRTRLNVDDIQNIDIVNYEDSGDRFAWIHTEEDCEFIRVSEEEVEALKELLEVTE